MKPIEELLKNLGRAEVLEFGLVTNRLPSVNIGGKFEPVDDEAPTTDVLLQMLVSMGGTRYVEQLSERPVQWTTRLDGVGVIAIAAIMRKDVVQARFTVARRDPKDGAGGASARPAADPRRAQAGAASSQNMPAAKAAAPAASAVAAGPGPHSSASQKAAPVDQAKPAAPAPAAALSPLTGAVPPPDDWDDDDEPTVQTLSPPVSLAPAPQAASPHAPPHAPPQSEEPKPKPARKPSEVAVASPNAAAQSKAAEDRKVAEERAAAERKVIEERAAAERKAAEERKVAEERAAAERKVIEERAAAERKAAEDRKAAEERAAADEQRSAAERAAQERVSADRAAADKRAAVERAAAERSAAAERAVAERKAAERAKVERRISTPTSVDAVDVEISTNQQGPRPQAVAKAALLQAPALELEIDNTVQLTSPSPAPPEVSRATAASLSHEVPSAVPSTTPSGTTTDADRADRPTRADGALESFLAMAVSARASDIHIVAGRPLLLRVATDLLPRTQAVQPDHVERMVRELVPTRLRQALETEGACDFALDHAKHGRFRVNVSRQRTGFKLSMRVVPREVPTLAALALPDGVSGATKYARGLVLITGPTGHGKTSTLAAIVDLLNRDTSRHILTLEDPIEYVHPRKRALISQREVGVHARSWGSAVKAALREDADVIVFGELRDADTVRLAIDASETGHLVIATINTPTAGKTVDRIIDMFGPNEQPEVRASVASALRLIIGQRLVPSADRTRLHAAVELLPSSIALYTLIRDARTFQIPSLQQRGRAQGVVRLDESLAELVRAQKVTLEVAKQFAESPQELEAHATRSVPSGSSRKA